MTRRFAERVERPAPFMQPEPPASAMPAETCDWFIAGFAAAYLKEAKTPLDALRPRIGDPR